MCGRFTLTWEEWRQVAGALGVEDEVDAFADYCPRFNIAPTDQHFIITSEFERRKPQRARWGLVNRWARDNSRASQFTNAKAETLEQRPTFSEAFLQRRCAVPADSFSEWTGPKSKRQRLWIHPRAGGLLIFAGLYESWYPEGNQPEVTFTIVTCAPNAAIAEVHDRMPVVLNERAAEDWMNPQERDPLSLKRLLVPARHDLLAMRPASPLANSVKNKGPALLECGEAATPDLFGSTRRRSVTFPE
jgi:putative SOS response-associated peptidase YedK